MRLASVKLSLDPRRSPDLVILGVFQRSAPNTEGLPKRLANAATRCCEAPGFKALEGQVQRAEAGGTQREMVEVHGLGTRAGFDDRKLRKWAAEVIEGAGTVSYTHLRAHET